MLKKTHISSIKMYIEDKSMRGEWAYRQSWKAARLGKFTSSRISVLCGERGIGEGGMNFIYDRVGEEICGYSADPEIDTDATRHGAKYESVALDKFKAVTGFEFIVRQQLITEPGSRSGSTPDAIVLIRESTDGLEYEAETVEAKCFPTFKAFIGLSLCKTPQDVKDYDRKIYFQVLHQILSCGAKKGYLVSYHPDFRTSNLTIIEFDVFGFIKVKGVNVFPIVEDLKLLEDRIAAADKLFVDTRDKLLAKGFV